MGPLATSPILPALLAAASEVPAGLRVETHLEPGESLVVVYLLGGASFLLWALVHLLLGLRQRRRAWLARRVFDASAPLVEGEITLHGQVQQAAGEQVAVRLEVTQDGRESEDSGVWTTRWTETSRRLLVAPFYLRLASGERVRVEPTDQTQLVDEMDGLLRVELTRRVRIAELIPGEQVYAHGALTPGVDPEAESGAYRSAPQSLVLRPPGKRPMLLSSLPLGERFARRQRLHNRVALVVLLLGLANLIIWVPYHARMWAGRDITARITDLRTWTTEDAEGERTNHYQVQALTEAGVGLQDEVPPQVYDQLVEGMRVPWRVVPSNPAFSAVGPGATVHMAALLVPVSLPFWVLGGWLYIRSRAAWYDQSRVKDTEKGRIGGE